MSKMKVGVNMANQNTFRDCGVKTYNFEYRKTLK